MKTVPEDLKHKIALSPGEVALLLSIDISTFYRNIYGFIRNGQIQSIKIGKSRRVLTKSLMDWIEKQAEREVSYGPTR